MTRKGSGRRKPVSAVWVIATIAAITGALLLAACGSSDDVRSGRGPEPSPQPAGRTGGSEPASSTTSTSAAPAKESADPVTSPMLAVVGNVVVPSGRAGELSVVMVGAQATSDGTTLPVIVRNRTGKTVYNIEASATARTTDGSLAGSGSSQGFLPSVVKPGEWAFGYVYFSGAEVPKGAKFDVTATADDDPGYSNMLDVKPVETNLTSGSYSKQVIGIVKNDLDRDVDGPVSVGVACFDAAGKALTSVTTSFTDADTVAAGGTASFTIDIFDDPCPVYAVGGSGFDR